MHHNQRVALICQNWRKPGCSNEDPVINFFLNQKKKKIRGSEETFFQRIHSDGQQAHEKILNITNHQRNANQNHNKLSLHTCQNSYYLKDKQQQVLARMWRKGNPPPHTHTDTVASMLSHSAMSSCLQPHDCSTPSSSVHGISQASILRWVAISYTVGGM